MISFSHLKKDKHTKSVPTTEKETTAPSSKQTLSEATLDQQTKTMPFWTSKWMVVIGSLIIILLFGAYLLKDWFVVATVNGKPITRLRVIQELEKQGGKQVLDNMITEILVEQEAANKGVTVDQVVIDTEIQKIEAQVAQQGQKLDDALALQGMTRANLERQIKIQQLVKLLSGNTASVSAEEIEKALETQAEFFPEEMSEEDRRSAITNQLQQQKSGQQVQTWMDDLKKNAAIQYYKNY